MTEQPTTAAGRALLDWFDFARKRGLAGIPQADAILAIEAEAHEQGMLRQLERQIHDEQQDGSAHSEFPTATPRPWTVDTLEGGGWAVVVDADGAGAKVIAELDDTYGDRAANAALIVEAVNALAALPPSAPPALDPCPHCEQVVLVDGEHWVPNGGGWSCARLEPDR